MAKRTTVRLSEIADRVGRFVSRDLNSSNRVASGARTLAPACSGGGSPTPSAGNGRGHGSKGTRVIALFVATALVASAGASEASADDLRVPQQFRNVRAALRKAKPGDRIVVSKGRYTGNVKLRKPGVSLVATGDVTLRNGRVQILADDVTVSGFTMDRMSMEIEGDRAHVVGNVLDQARRRRGDVVQVRARDAELRGNTISADESPRSAAGEAISVVGDGAVLAENFITANPFQPPVEVDGDGVNLSGNRISGSFAPVVTGNSAVIDGNQLDPLGAGAPGLTVTGDGAVVTGNALNGAPAVLVDGDGAEVGGNDVTAPVAGDSVVVQGDGANVHDNDVGGAATGTAVRVEGDDARVGGNRISGTVRESVRVIGDRAAVRDNVAGRAGSVAILVRGDDVVISGNETTSAPIGIHVHGTGFTVEDNSLSGIGVTAGPDPAEAPGFTGIQVYVDPYAGERTSSGRISGNTLRHVRGHAISVTGDRVTVRGNVVVQTPGAVGDPSDAGILVFGDEAEILDNEIGGPTGEGIQVAGDRNLAEDNTVTGVRSCGYLLDGASNTVRRCVSEDCQMGLLNRGTRTTVTDSRFEGSPLGDVVNEGWFLSFLRNVVSDDGN